MTTSADRLVARRTRNIVLAVCVLFLAAWPLAVPVSPLQDQMDWALQAAIMAHPDSPQWSADYAVDLAPVPNMLGTLVIAALAKVLPVFRAAAVAYALYLALFVAAFTYLVRGGDRERPWAELAGVAYAANHFFLMGFFNFVLGIALLWVALGWLRRHGDNARAPGWALFGLCVTLIYLSHFLAFAILGLGTLLFAAATYRGAWRRWLAPAAAFAPALACLAWYARAHSSEFLIRFAFHNPLYYIWYKVGPWALASNYYPLTPAPAAWINAAINAVTIMAIGGFFVWAALRRRWDPRDTMAWLAGALLVIGLLTPTRLYELLRPGQRLIFVALLLGFAATRIPWAATRRRYATVVAALAVLLVWNAVWWGQAAGRLTDDAARLDQHVQPGARLLVVADSHFHFRENRPYREKLADPFSYPNSVNPLRYLPYRQVVLRGGYLRELFGTGVIHVRQPKKLPAVNRLWQLDDPDGAGRYTDLVATGLRPNLEAIAQRAAPLFERRHLGENLLIMRRKEN